MKNATQKNYLQSMHIQRFRSIADLSIEFAPITIFVGANDSGKSNILKAVNLFFNKKVDIASPYEHSRDYFNGASTGRGNRVTVALTATINFPYNTKGTITASRYWKKDGFSARSSKMTYKPILGKRSNIPNWFEKLSYRYVPANKEDKYMKDLMRELYKLYAVSINENVRSGTVGFIESIRQETSTISDEVKEVLGLDSRIQLPGDISKLFELFDFETNDKISLKQRGDGIRVRHIPAILNFLADRNNQPSGSVRGETIWGYEEPENNLEMMAAFEQAKQFVKYSSNIQILITTHSPAFYQMIESEKNCKCYYVEKDKNNTTQITEITKDNINQIDKDMGLMPLIAPHVRKIQSIKEDSKKSEWAIDKKMIVVEGDFDKKVLEYCIRKMSYKDIYIYAAGGGDKVGEIIGARRLACKEHKNKCVGLLDNDNKGEDIRKEYGSNIKSNNSLMLLNMPEQLGLMYQGKIAINLEAFLPLRYWEEAKRNDFLEESGAFFKNPFVSDIGQVDKVIESMKRKYPEIWLYMCYKVKRISKDKFKKLVMSKLNEEENIPPALETEVRRIVESLQSK